MISESESNWKWVKHCRFGWHYRIILFKLIIYNIKNNKLIQPIEWIFIYCVRETWVFVWEKELFVNLLLLLTIFTVGKMTTMARARFFYYLLNVNNIKKKREERDETFFLKSDCFLKKISMWFWFLIITIWNGYSSNRMVIKTTMAIMGRRDG